MTSDAATNRSARIFRIFAYLVIFLGVFLSQSIFDYMVHYDYFSVLIIFPYAVFFLALLIFAVVLLIKTKFIPAAIVLAAFLCAWLIDFEIEVIDYFRVQNLVAAGTINSDVMRWGEQPFYQYNYETLLVRNSSGELADIHFLLNKEGYDHLSESCSLDVSRVHPDFVVVRGWC
ncbi:hypothetical protein [Labrenzia sp. VG12]|uniref:hypothetical protein n=1 Tax=Labrenzia sp. VG12 TaxID=2021862 RepID=UPI000B8BC2F8|nr:hypothetical protein [Labrenzia sp. VG12]ASP33811.1 hypothetical protein CHH27_11615 [Labrenzia sp. VG12]